MAEGLLGEIARRKRVDIEARLGGAMPDPEPTRRSLRSALARPGARFMMEVKKASPSGHSSTIEVDEAVKAYSPVADAISILTDREFFRGSLEDVRAARSMFDGPILAKDFIVDVRQVAEARAHGADAVLAILGILDDLQAAAVLAEARRLGMDVLVEIHDEVELQRALALGSEIIGINNRDLRTLKTNIAVTERLARLVPKDCILISESGFKARSEVERVAPNVDGFLVGSSLMAARDIRFSARSLVHGPVKICGLTSTQDVMLAAKLGATHCGFIFVQSSPRRVGSHAAALSRKCRGLGMRSVGIFKEAPNALVISTVRRLGLDAVQIHGAETDLERLRDELEGACEIWAVCGVDKVAERAKPGSDRTIFDTRVNGRTGGTGKSFNWELVAGRNDLASAFLAGGIGPANARSAQRAGAFGIDVGSAVETAPGQKDPDRMRALFSAIRPPCRRAAICG